MSDLRLVLAVAGLLLAARPGFAQNADIDADEFCRKAGRNQAIFEFLMEKGTAQLGAQPGSVTCSWTFKGRKEFSATLESKLFRSPIAARQEILMARLPERNRGKTIAPVRAGDDGLSRATTVKNGVTKLFEIEAVKGRRHFLLTVRPSTSDGDLDYKIQAATTNFIAVGINALSR